MADRARIEFQYSNGDAIILHEPWDPEIHEEGGWDEGEPGFGTVTDNVQRDFHPVQYMDVYSKGSLVHVNVYCVGDA